MSEVLNKETGELTPQPEVEDDNSLADPDGAPDEPTPDDGDTAARAEPTTPEQFEKMLTAAEKEATRHASAVGRIFGDEAVSLQLCPLCSPAVPGFITPAESHDEGKAAIIQALGLGPEESFQHEPGAEPCTECNALGMVLTGSKVPEHAQKVCAGCGGKGWTNATERAAIQNGRAASEAVAANIGAHSIAAPAPLTVAETDFMGRPAGHGNYGKLPQYLTPDEKALDVRDGYATDTSAAA